MIFAAPFYPIQGIPPHPHLQLPPPLPRQSQWSLMQSVLQGSAADIIKTAMVRLHAAIQASLPGRCRILLSVSTASFHFTPWSCGLSCVAAMAGFNKVAVTVRATSPPHSSVTASTKIALFSSTSLSLCFPIRQKEQSPNMICEISHPQGSSRRTGGFQAWFAAQVRKPMPPPPLPTMIRPRIKIFLQTYDELVVEARGQGAGSYPTEEGNIPLYLPPPFPLP